MFGGNVSAAKVGCVNQALHGFLESELFKTRSNNYWNLWIRFIASARLQLMSMWQQFATSSKRRSNCITLTCILSDATNVPFTLHHNSLANAEVWRCIFIWVRLAIHIIVIQFPNAQQFKFTIRCFAQHQFSGEYSAFGVDGRWDIFLKFRCMDMWLSMFFFIRNPLDEHLILIFGHTCKRSQHCSRTQYIFVFQAPSIF